MKNLFKSLMLVAVAAMAFTACQNEPETVINNGKTTVVFNPIFDETRSYFGEKEGESYPSSWSGNEVAKFNHWTSAGNHQNIEVAINGEDRFSVTFDALSVGNTVDAYVPAASWGDVNIQWDGGYNNVEEVNRDYTIPAEQNPSATSVDEKAHILKATTTYEGGNTMDLYFEHQVAYGKLSLQNFAGSEISQYAITIDGEMYVVNSTLDAGVWFACEPATVQNMTVSVKASEGTYTKQIVTDGNPTLAFKKGRVSTFTVDMTDRTPGEAVDTFKPDYLATSCTWTGSYFDLRNEEWGNTSYVYIYMNSADVHDNMIEIGDYAPMGSGYAPTDNKFSAKSNLGFYASGCQSLSVSFKDGNYEILLTAGGNTYGYKGMPEEGFTAPGKVKTALATPVVTAEVVNDKNVNVTWNAVANAANYTVSVNGVEKEAANTSRTYTIEGTYATEYTITVVANPAVDSEDYKASAAGSATVTTNDDPNAGGGEEPEEPEQPEGAAATLTYVQGAGNSYDAAIFQCSGAYSGYIKIGLPNGLTDGTWDLTASGVSQYCGYGTSAWSMPSFTDGTVVISGTTIVVTATLNGTLVTATGTFTL